jgi:hypothetical protein
MRQAQQQKIQREEAILSSLKKLDYLSRGQIQRMHDLGGERNARRVLANLSEFVASFRGESGESIFYLNRAGRERVCAEFVRQKTNQVNHFLMRNDFYIRFSPEDWKNEMKMSVKDVVTVIPDAYFRYEMRRHFLEVDHLQHMHKNREKIAKYRKLKETRAFQEKLMYFPRLVWVTMTEGRKKQLLEWCVGLETVIYTWDEIR